MKTKEIRQLPNEDLQAQIDKAREKVFRMKFQAKGKDVEHPGQLKALRKDIARFQTVLRERELAAREQTAKEPKNRQEQ